MAAVMTRVRVDDYETWKQKFDTDPFGVRDAATDVRVLRLIEDPNEVQIIVDFPTADDASAARDKLLASGALERVKVTVPPAIATDGGAGS